MRLPKRKGSRAAELRKSNNQTPLSSYIYGKLSPDTQHLVDSSSDDSALRKALSKDLNAIARQATIL